MPATGQHHAVGSGFSRILLSVVLLFAPAIAAAQTAVPPAFLGTWQSLGLNPGPPPLGAPPTELPYEVIDKTLADGKTVSFKPE